MLRSFIPLLVLAAACDGAISDPEFFGPSVPEGEYVPAVELLRACDAEELRPAEAPLRRLSHAEYEASVRMLFPGVPLPALSLPQDERVHGFDNHVSSQTVSDLLMEAYARAAADIARAAVDNPAWMGCASDEAGCADSLALSLSELAYRRPLDDDERANALALVQTLEDALGFDEAVEGFIEGLLQSPAFLYRPERGTTAIEAPDGLVALSPFEMAARLSFALWQAAPDEALREDAAAGRLDTRQGVREVAERLLSDERARRIVARFHAQWLGYEDLESVDLDPTSFPELDASLLQSMRDSADAFVMDTVLDEPSLDGFMTSDRLYVNDELASLLDMRAPGGEDLRSQSAPAGERAGILTQPAVLASTSHGTGHAPILRGLMVLDAMLCASPPSPPQNVDISMTNERDGEDALTTRQLVEESHGSNACQSCHATIDGVGFAFENFDALGRYRTEENGQPIDSSARLNREEFAGAPDMAGALAQDDRVFRCMVTQWYRYALGRDETEGDRCQIDALALELRDSRDPRELILALLTSNAFRFRPEVR